MGVATIIDMALVDCVPSQMTTDEITLMGPDSRSMTFKHDAGATVADAKHFFADSTSAPTEYIKVFREDGLEVINEDTPLRSGEQLTILYTLAGGGSCKCEVKCKCETDFPHLCQLGCRCDHC